VTTKILGKPLKPLIYGLLIENQFFKVLLVSEARSGQGTPSLADSISDLGALNGNPAICRTAITSEMSP
jgi:hypothetical protein